MDKELTFDEWVEQYKPDLGGYTAGLYETYGNDFAFVCKQDPHTVWTLCNDGETDFISNGFHFVNRLGFYVTAVPFADDDTIIVIVETEWEDCEIDPEEREEVMKALTACGL